MVRKKARCRANSTHKPREYIFWQSRTQTGGNENGLAMKTLVLSTAVSSIVSAAATILLFLIVTTVAPTSTLAVATVATSSSRVVSSSSASSATSIATIVGKVDLDPTAVELLLVEGIDCLISLIHSFQDYKSLVAISLFFCVVLVVEPVLLVTAVVH